MNEYPVKKCKVCEVDFAPKNRLKIYCSKECEKKAQKMRYHENYIKRPAFTDKKCAMCGADYKGARNQLFCSDKCRKKKRVIDQTKYRNKILGRFPAGKQLIEF